jgi:altronate hydrolase
MTHHILQHGAGVFVILAKLRAAKGMAEQEDAIGEVGIRNELWILPTVGCVNGIARQILQRFLKETADTDSDPDR